MRKLSMVLVAVSASACSVAPAEARAQQPIPENVRTIQVSAQATVQRAPDRATVHLAVENVAESARDATARNAAAMEAVLSAVRALGVPPARIRTTRVELHPRYDQRRQAADAPVIVGYQAVNQVMVQLEDIALVGRVVDAAVQAGANRVTGVSFALSDPEAAYHEALRLAIGQARAEAEVAARALGESLGPALRVSTGGFHAPAPRRMGMEAMRMDMAAAPPPVEPGELEVPASVSITYRLGS